MSAFASTAFSTSAFSTSAFSFNVTPAPTTAGLTVDPFSVSDAAQLFKKVAWDAQGKAPEPYDGRTTRFDLSQPTLQQQRQRIEATQKVRAQEKQERETALWLASMLPQLEALADD